MKLLILASYRFFRQHPGQWWMALVGIAAGVAVMSGVWLMQQALVGSIEQATAQLMGQPTARLTAAEGPLDESVYRDLALIPGAPDLYPLIEVDVTLEDQALTILGLDPLMGLGNHHRLAGSPVAGQLLSGDRGVVISQALAARQSLQVGDRIDLAQGTERIWFEVAAIAEMGRVLDDYVLMDLASAQQHWVGPGVLSAIEVPIEALDWLTAHAPNQMVISTAASEQRRVSDLSRGMRTNLLAMSLLALAVGLLVVYAVLSFLLVQRLKTIALMRAVGVQRRWVLTALALEVFVLALLGGGLGLVLGTSLADGLLALVSQPYSLLYGTSAASQIQPTWTLYGGLWAFTVLMAFVSVSSVLIEAFRVSPAQGVRAPTQKNKATLPWLWLAWLPLMGGLVLILIPQSLPMALAGLFLVLLSLSVWLPYLGLASLARLRHRLGGGLTQRGLMMLLSARHRLGPAVASLSLALALGAGIGMMVLGFRGAVDHWVGQLLRADAYLTSDQIPITVDLSQSLLAQPAIEAISSVRRWPHAKDVNVLAYELPEAAWAGFEWVAISDTFDDLDALKNTFEQGQGWLVTEPLANKQGLKVGDPLQVNTPQGPLTLPILAIYRDYASDQGSVAIDDQAYIDLWEDQNKDSLGVYLMPGRDLSELPDVLASLNLIDQLTITGRQTIRDETLRVFDDTFRISWALAFLVGLIASLALISALLAIGIERGREYATLRAVGLTHGQLKALVMAQTLGLALLAMLLALPLSLVIHAVLSLVIQPLAFGWRIDWQLPLGPWAVTAMVSLMVGALAGLYPAKFITKTAPARLLRSWS